MPNSILDAPIPSKCFYAWRNILQSTDVIKKIAIWRMGDGQNISIWDHNWLPILGMSKVVLPRIDAELNKVCDLFYPNTKMWNTKVLQNSFYPWEANLIRKIYVSALCNEDYLVCPKSSDGCYSVKFAYQMLITKVISGAFSLSTGEDSKV